MLQHSVQRKNHGPTWARLLMAWVKTRDSLWFIPSALTLAATGLAVLLVELDRLLPEHDPTWLLVAGAEGAREVLSTIASGLITVTGVVFSVTIVAIQLASSQFTPRILRNFTADRVNQLVLGVFIGTFTYAILVLRVIRTETATEPAFVPRIAAAVAVILVLISIGFLIYFINHAAASMRVSVILDRVSELTLRHIERQFPDPVDPTEAKGRPPPVAPEAETAWVRARESGYLQAVDRDALYECGQARHLLIRMECQVGDFLAPGLPLVSVSPLMRADEALCRLVEQAFVLGAERTPEQDVGFGIVEISDIAVKALSPAINDPTTAVSCIDRLTELLLHLAPRQAPADRRSDSGELHLLTRDLDFDDAVSAAFDQIRHYGADNPMIARRLLTSLSVLIERAPPRRRAALVTQVEAVLQAASATIAGDHDRDSVEAVAARLRLPEREPARRR